MDQYKCRGKLSKNFQDHWPYEFPQEKVWTNDWSIWISPGKGMDQWPSKFSEGFGLDRHWFIECSSLRKKGRQPYHFLECFWTRSRVRISDKLRGPLNRLNAILSLLHPLDRYRTPSAIGSTIGRPLSRPTSHPRSGRITRPPHPIFLKRLNRVIVVLQGGGSFTYSWSFFACSWASLLAVCWDVH